MGQGASRTVGRSGGIIVTLDALGTLYKFRKPVAVQYIDVARRTGITTEINPNQLKEAFKAAYKQQVVQYPNYGLGQLSEPSEWWEKLVRTTFSSIVTEIPEELPQRLYDHFSSADAYELHSDVLPFLRIIHSLRDRLSDPQGPAVVTGIITNSDPRVLQVLKALSLKVGMVKIPTREEIRESATKSALSGQFTTPWSNAYDPKNDFDFLVTGYEAEAEKPDPAIWKYADFQASLATIGRSQKSLKLPEGKLRNAFAVVVNAISTVGKTENMRWIHIGDEYEKDYVGAKSFGREALLLDRINEVEVDADKITSLEEAAVVVSLMVHEMLEVRRDSEEV